MLPSKSTDWKRELHVKHAFTAIPRLNNGAFLSTKLTIKLTIIRNKGGESPKQEIELGQEPKNSHRQTQSLCLEVNRLCPVCQGWETTRYKLYWWWPGPTLPLLILLCLLSEGTRDANQNSWDFPLQALLKWAEAKILLPLFLQQNVPAPKFSFYYRAYLVPNIAKF